MTVPYKISYFLIFFTIPLMGSLLLLFIRFLFFENKHHIRNNGNNNNNSNNSNRYFIISIFLFTSSIIGIIFTISAFSSWNYIPIEITTILSILICLFYTIYQLIIQFQFERKKQYKIKSNKYFISSPPTYNNNGIIITEESGENEDSNNNGKFKESILLESLNKKDEGYEEEEEEFEDEKQEKEELKIKFSNLIKYFIKDTINTIKFKPRLSIILICISLFISIMIPVVFNGVCICSHPMSVSTSFTRKLFQSSYCKPNEICFLYLTLPEDPTTSMILQIHTYNKPIEIKILLSSGNSNITEEEVVVVVSNNFISMSEIIKDEPRYISFIDLVNLKPSTEYSFKVNIKIKGGNDMITSSSKDIKYKFKTFSNEIESEIKFVSGGDIVLNKDSEALGELANKFKPDFFIIGGDIVYEDGIGSCYRRWDEKLNYFKNYFYSKSQPIGGDGMNETVINLIPMLLSIGNHEAGAFFQTQKQVPFYFKYFQFKINDFGNIKSSKSSSYHIHKITNHTSIVSLDSCVVSTWEQQTKWLDNQWSSDNYYNTSKLVVYHHPIYPSWGNLDDILISKLGRDSMVPLFDKYSIPFVFENHEHLFKRTKSLKNNKVVDNNNNTNTSTGTIYIGDGSLGISPTNDKPIENDNNNNQLPWYLSKRSYCNHLWFATINNKQFKIEAFSPNGDKIDKIHLNK